MRDVNVVWDPLTSPDSYFPWNDILQVIVPRTSAFASAVGPSDNTITEEGITMCPICLSAPTSPRMTKCGHVSAVIEFLPLELTALF